MITPAVGVIIFNKAKTEVLLVKHKGNSDHIEGKVGLPAGKIEDKDVLDVAIEKLHKETGITVSKSSLTKLPFEYTACIDRNDGSKKEFSLVIYYCDVKEVHPCETLENIPFWARIDNLEKLDLLPNIKKATLDALNFLKI